MLGEGFLQMMPYSEERRVAQAGVTHTHSAAADALPPGSLNDSSLDPDTDPDTGPRTLCADAGLQQKRCGPNPILRPRPAAAPLPVPGGYPSGSSSLLQEYPDLRLGQSPGEPDSPEESAELGPRGLQHHRAPPPGVATPPRRHSPPRPDRQRRETPYSAAPDQGYLVMGGGGGPSPGRGGAGCCLEARLSNSLLNGLLERQLEEVYLQHLTESLARCDSQPGFSLLRRLVPPPPPTGRRAAPGPDDFPEPAPESEEGAGLEEERSQTMGYLSAHNTRFSSPVLRISEAEETRAPAPQ